MDRTNWKFGQQNINVLVLAVVYHGVAFPLLFRLLPKFGNSNTDERIELVERYIRLFGSAALDCLTAVIIPDQCEPLIPIQSEPLFRTKVNHLLK